MFGSIEKPQHGSGCRRGTHSGRAKLERLRSRIADEQVLRGHGESEPAADALVSAVREANNLEWSSMNGPAAMATVAELETARRGIETALAAGMDHLDRTGATETVGGLSAHGWLSHSSRGSRSTAKRSVELGRVLHRFPGFAEAIADGRLSTDHAMALHAVSNPRITDLLDEAEPTLLDMAQDVTFAAFRRNLTVIARHLDQDGPQPDCTDTDRLTITTNGEPLDPTTSAVLACDAWRHPIIVDTATNTPLFAGRGTRYATPDQRRALIARDGGCVFPGCDAPASWCDAHHIIPWEHGGTTDLDTLALLCRHHHGYAHSNNWTLQAIPIRFRSDGTPAPRGAIHLIWHTPNGTINAQQASDQRRPPPPREPAA